MQEEGKLQVRDKLPKFLSGHNFLIKVAVLDENIEDDEEGLVEVDGKESATHEVAMVSKLCTDLEVGDEVIMKPIDFLHKNRMAFRVGDFEYFMYSQHDIQGVW